MNVINNEIEFIRSLKSAKHVSTFTHNFYRYPARFSPEFARETILRFTKQGDYVLDAFMGSGTTIVEAIANGRNAIGFDISPLAFFVTKVKTTPLSTRDQYSIYAWAESIDLEQSSEMELAIGELNNVPDSMRNILIYIANTIHSLNTSRQKNFARCVLLKLGQWMLDCRAGELTKEKIQKEFIGQVSEMLHGLNELVSSAQEKGTPKNKITGSRRIFLSSVNKLQNRKFLYENKPKIKLVLTSPPYPGVHVLYHRWQVNSRKETSAPFWLAGLKDGHGEAYYTMGGRSKKGLTTYFQSLSNLFLSLKNCISDDALVAQLVAFANPELQLPNFLEAMNAAGYEEAFLMNSGNNSRLSREVPHRKWYTNLQDEGSQNASLETLLFHRPMADLI